MIVLRDLARRILAAPLAPFAGLLLVAPLTLTACCASGCDLPYDRGGPEATLASFHRAVRCDDRDAEYACFSTRIKRSFGGFSAYSIARQELREKNPLALRFIRHADLEGRVRITLAASGTRATALVDVGGGDTLEVVLVDEPEYRLHHADGSTTIGYADRASVSSRKDGFRIDVVDKDIELESEAPVQRPELLAHWVIDDFPGLAAAIEAARAEQNQP